MQVAGNLLNHQIPQGQKPVSKFCSAPLTNQGLNGKIPTTYWKEKAP